MKYNYSINHEDIGKIHDLISQQPNISSQFSFIDIILIIFTIITFLFLIFITLDDPDIGCGFSLFVLPLIVFSIINVFSSEDVEDEWKKDIITAASPSLDDENKYKNFKINIMRYLETQNIDLSKNCNSTSGPIRGYSKDKYPVFNIVCDKSHKNLSGEIVFIDENDEIRKFIYNTSVNKNNDYLEFTLEESEQ